MFDSLTIPPESERGREVGRESLMAPGFGPLPLAESMGARGRRSKREEEQEGGATRGRRNKREESDLNFSKTTVQAVTKETADWLPVLGTCNMSQLSGS